MVTTAQNLIKLAFLILNKKNRKLNKVKFDGLETSLVAENVQEDVEFI